MTHHPQHPTLDRPGCTATSPPDARADGHIGRAALVAGGSLLLMSVLAAFGNLVVLEGLVTAGDPTRTAADVTSSVTTFRWGIASLYLVVVLDVVVAWALLHVLSPVDRALSRLSAWFRLTYSAVFLVALSHLMGIPRLLSGEGYADAFTPEQAAGQAMLKVDTFTDVWMAGLVLFGFHLALTGYLVYRSGFVPRFIGVLLVVAGAGYALDSLASVVLASPPFVVSTVTFVGELLLGGWLLLRGRRLDTVGGAA